MICVSLSRDAQIVSYCVVGYFQEQKFSQNLRIKCNLWKHYLKNVYQKQLSLCALCNYMKIFPLKNNLLYHTFHYFFFYASSLIHYNYSTEHVWVLLAYNPLQCLKIASIILYCFLYLQHKLWIKMANFVAAKDFNFPNISVAFPYTVCVINITIHLYFSW